MQHTMYRQTAGQFLLSVLLLLSGLIFAEDHVSLERAQKPLQDLALPDNVNAVKLHVLPSRRTPLYVELVLTEPPDLKIYRSTGRYPLYTGPIGLVYGKKLDFEEYRPTSSDLEALAKIPEDEKPTGDYLGARDGDTYLLEIKIGKHYHRIERGDPSDASEKRGLKEMAAFCDWLLKLGGVYPIHMPLK